MRLSNFFRLFVLFGLLLLGAERQASATQVYDFAIPGSEYSQWFYNSDPSLNRAFVGTNGGTAHITYNEITGAIALSISTTGNIYGVTIGAGGAAQLNNTVLASNVTATMSMILAGGHEVSNPYGLLGSSTTSGTATLSDLGFGGPVSYSVMAKPMDWNVYAGADANSGYINDMKPFGLANFFQYYATHEWGSDKLYATPLLVFQLWTGSVGQLGSCGTFTSVGGDIHGTAVPEPATLGLLGLGLFGSRFRRRKLA